MQVNIRHTANLQFEAVTRGHKIIGDQPTSNGGEDVGMTPPEWFLASLGSCIGFYVVKYCEARNIDTADLDIGISAEKTKDRPYRIDQIKINLNFPMQLERRHFAGLERAVNQCLIHNTLTHPPTIMTQISTPAIANHPVALSSVKSHTS
jgi:uncharacterized OsmC-like protein